MIKHQEDGLWMAKCDICSWKTFEAKEAKARRKLSRHFNVSHKTGYRNKPRRRRLPPRVVDRRIRGRQRVN